MTSLQEKVAALVAQWNGLDATVRSGQQAQLVADVIRVISEELGKDRRGDQTPFCAFCGPRYLDSFFSGLVDAKKRPAA